MKTEAQPQHWSRDARLILFHKHRSSARTVFLRHSSGSIIAPDPLPFLSSIIDEEEPETLPEAQVIHHPAALAHAYCVGLGLDPDILTVEGEFQGQVETPAGTVMVYLARFTCIDPPRTQFDAWGGRFCAITELRGGHPAEMALLQRAYVTIMG